MLSPECPDEATPVYEYGGVPGFSGESDHSWRGTPPINELGLILWGEHYSFVRFERIAWIGPLLSPLGSAHSQIPSCEFWEQATLFAALAFDDLHTSFQLTCVYIIYIYIMCIYICIHYCMYLYCAVPSAVLGLGKDESGMPVSDRVEILPIGQLVRVKLRLPGLLPRARGTWRGSSRTGG